MGCGNSQFIVEDQAGPPSSSNHLLEHNVHPIDEDADRGSSGSGKEQALKEVKMKWDDSEDSMEKEGGLEKKEVEMAMEHEKEVPEKAMQQEREEEEEEEERVCKEMIEEEEAELSDGREDRLTAAVSPSFRVYCGDCDSGSSSKEGDDDEAKSKTKSQKKPYLDIKKVLKIQAAKKERRRRGIRSVLKNAKSMRKFSKTN